MNNIVPIGLWYDNQTLSESFLQCLQSFIQYVEREEGATLVSTSRRSINAGVTGTPSPLNTVGSRPRAPGLSSRGSGLNNFSPPAAAQALPVVPPSFLHVRNPLDNGIEVIFESTLTPGLGDPHEDFGEVIPYELTDMIYLDPVQEGDVGEGTWDAQWS